MKWAETFYRKQNELGNGAVYFGDVQEQHRKKVTVIERLTGTGPKQILELGAGGGQNAAAAVELGHTVVTVEMEPEFAAHIRQLAAALPADALRVIEGSFLEINLNSQFDLVVYWDGFGIGSDSDQRRLLKRVAGWLKQAGCALIDVGTPWHWGGKAVGQGWSFGGAKRQYDFDADGCRTIDRWWPIDDESQVIAQSLRCYSPADLRLLLEGTGLTLQTLEPGGAMDYEQMTYTERVPLKEAMGYVAKLVLSEG